MERNGVPMQDPDLQYFDENRSKFPLEQLLAFAGHHVAWSPDGTRILAFATTRADLNQKLEAAGIPLGQVVHDYIDAPLE
jgi:hypothetical protein